MASASEKPQASEGLAFRNSRFLTLEFLVYFCLILYALLDSVVVLREYMLEVHPRHIRGLRRGWIPGREYVDLQDQQWSFFRGQLPLLTGAAVGFLLLSHAIRGKGNSFQRRILFYLVFGVGFLGVINGLCVIWIFTIVLINFGIARIFRGTFLNPVLTWTFACAVLLSNERWDGYRFEEVFGFEYRWMDRYRGMFPWQNLFNLVILRMISYNMDYFYYHRKLNTPVEMDEQASSSEASGKVSSSKTTNRRSHRYKDGWNLSDRKSWGVHAKTCKTCRLEDQNTADALGAPACLTWRERELPKSVKDFGLHVYIAYLFYAPLHLAGPTLSFQAFVSQVRRPQTSYSFGRVLIYAVRWVVCLLLLEIILHNLYLFSFTNSMLWRQLSPKAICILSYWILKAMWLKFLLIWRFFRLWALSDGVETWENMNRCLSNNYSVVQFWRQWHRSFNKWLLRYLFIPLGGSAKSSNSPVVRKFWELFNIFIVFSFVAFWHDRTLKLLMWGWGVALLFLPEKLCTMWTEANPQIVAKPWFRHIKAVFAAVNITCLVMINIVGYSSPSMLWHLFDDGGFGVSWMLLQFYAAAHFMFEIRRLEGNRKGY